MLGAGASPAGRWPGLVVYLGGALTGSLGRWCAGVALGGPVLLRCGPHRLGHNHHPGKTKA
jgi:hypothetical protein